LNIQWAKEENIRLDNQASKSTGSLVDVNDHSNRSESSVKLKGKMKVSSQLDLSKDPSKHSDSLEMINIPETEDSHSEPLQGSSNEVGRHLFPIQTPFFFPWLFSLF
jgi:hypothetical protein